MAAQLFLPHNMNNMHLLDRLSFPARLTLQVQLLQEIGTPREERPVTPGRPPAKGAPAAAPPGVVDLSGMTLGPCPLVPADQAAGAQVVQLHLQSAEPLPDTLQAASVAAGMSGRASPVAYAKPQDV